jgi:hypothetical protein
MSAPLAYKVLTEFRFEIGSAVTNTRTLAGEVNKISDAAGNAQQALTGVGVSLVQSFGVGYLTVGGTIFKAFMASEKFYQSQLKLSNIFLSKKFFEGPQAFQQSMAASADALERMKSTARQFSLPATALAGLSSSIGAALTVKGLDDSSLSKSTDLSRAFLKSAPILLPGQDPLAYQGQLMNLVSGRANIGGTLVQRLMDETSAMKPFAGKGGTGKFNALDPAKRLDVLTKSLDQFSKQVKVNDAIAKSFTGQMQRMRDNLFSMFSIFRKIGDAIRIPLTDIIKNVNDWIETHGEKIANNMGSMLERILRDPVKLFVNLQTLKGMGSDFSAAGAFLKLLTQLEFAAFAATGLGGLGLLGGFSAGAVKFGNIVKKIVGWFLPLSTLASGGMIAGIGKLLLAVGRLFGFIFFMLQTITMAGAKASVHNKLWLAENSSKVSDIIVKLSKAFSAILYPITAGMDALAEVISLFFRLDLSGNFLIATFEILASVLEFLGKVVLRIFGFIQGVVDMLTQIPLNLSSWMSGDIGFSDMLSQMGDTFMRGWDYHYNKIYGDENEVPYAPGKGKTSKNTTYMNVNMYNQFKEQMEPDRIAFTLQEQLFKAATNPRGTKRRSFQRGSLKK